jgi:hypothetical protein
MVRLSQIRDVRLVKDFSTQSKHDLHGLGESYDVLFVTRKRRAKRSILGFIEHAYCKVAKYSGATSKPSDVSTTKEKGLVTATKSLCRRRGHSAITNYQSTEVGELVDNWGNKKFHSASCCI